MFSRNYSTKIVDIYEHDVRKFHKKVQKTINYCTKATFCPLHSPLFSQRTHRKVIKAHHIPVAAKAPQSLRTLTIRRQCCHHNTLKSSDFNA